MLPTPRRHHFVPAPRLPWALIDWLVLAVITLAGGALRFVRLAFPHSIMFDETYYAKDACLYLGKGAAYCATGGATEQSYVHPPLGKLIIAAGEWFWGYNSFGWRIMACLFGTALIALTFLLGRKLFGRWAAAIAALLVATDFLLIVQSRIAMLDIFLAFFVVLGFLFVVYDRERVLRLREAGQGKLNIGWRVAAGLSFGAASAVKWSGLYALGGAGLLLMIWSVFVAWRVSRAAHQEGRKSEAPSPWLELPVTFLAVIVPGVVVYLVVYWLAAATHTLYLDGNHLNWSSLWKLHRDMYQYHMHLRVTHSYASRPWTWPIIKRPVAYYFTGGYKATHVMAFANPATWWLALGAGAWGIYKAIRRRYSPYRVVMTGWLFQYLPWLIIARPQFFFYMTPVAPFMMLALAGTLRDFAKGSRWRTAIVGIYLFFATVVLLWWWYPVVAGVPIPFSWWQKRMLFNSWI